MRTITLRIVPPVAVAITVIAVATLWLALTTDL